MLPELTHCYLSWVAVVAAQLERIRFYRSKEHADLRMQIAYEAKYSAGTVKAARKFKNLLGTKSQAQTIGVLKSDKRESLTGPFLPMFWVTVVVGLINVGAVMMYICRSQERSPPVEDCGKNRMASFADALI